MSREALDNILEPLRKSQRTVIILDTKGARFGFALVWTQIKTPECLARFVLLIGLAILLLTAVGHAVAARDPSVRLPCKTKGPRLSFLSVGSLLWPIIQSQILITPRFLDDHLPPPALRSFPSASSNILLKICPRYRLQQTTNFIP